MSEQCRKVEHRHEAGEVGSRVLSGIRHITWGNRRKGQPKKSSCMKYPINSLLRGYYFALSANSFFCLKITNFSICTTHLLANSSSVNLFADSRARRRIASLSSRASACSKALANSEAVVAWKP